MMPYTLMMGLAWFAAAFVLGLVVGIVLRSVTARRQVERARAAAVPTGPAVTTARVAELEDELAAMRAERDRWMAEQRAADAPAVHVTTAPTDGRPEESTGERSAADDLTAIVGLPPHVAELCHGIGIHTYTELAATEVSLLRTLLDDAGPRWRVHDPTTWPDQARLLAEGRHEEFAAVAAALRDVGAASDADRDGADRDGADRDGAHRDGTSVASPDRGGMIG